MSSICVCRFNATQLPVKHAVSEEFGIFNKYYSSVPSASYPNHLFAQSATSCGVHDNLLFNECGGNTVQYPQMTVFDSLALHNVSFGLYVNSTCGVDGIPCGTQPVFFRNITAGLDPDIIMAGVGRHKKKFFSQKLFYKQAAAGTLPSFSWLSPPLQACDHPCQSHPAPDEARPSL